MHFGMYLNKKEAKKLEIIITKNYDEMSKKAAAIVSSQMILKKDSIIGLATGSTPIGLYKHLIEANRRGDIDFSSTKTFNLDEYYGIDRDHDQSYYSFIMENLIKHINIDTKNFDIPNCMLQDIEQECHDYEERIKAAGGIDLQILGIGNNGHIGFNEPDKVFSKSTHLVNLSPETIECNARFFNSIEEVPTQAVTMGIQTIMKCKKIILLASGTAKADAIYKIINGEIDPMVQASILQLHHDVTIIIDEEAATRLL